MKKLYTSILFLTLTAGFSQVPFWTETFGLGCSQGTMANGFNPTVNGAWSTTATGVNDFAANEWYISATEAGMGLGACGDGCISTPSLTNRTLHVGSVTDPGAAYLVGNGLADTHKRAMSPVINCTGQNTITLSFLYFTKGVPGLDFFNVQYSANGGATWSVISTPPQTLPICPGPTPTPGYWTSYSVALPATANGNNNVKIGFGWQNIDNTGGDPSVALDDVKLTSLSPPVFAATFTLTNPLCSGKSATVTANTGTFVASGYTWTASPAGPIITSPNASVTNINFPTAGSFSITLTATSGTNVATSTQTILVNPTPTLTPSTSTNVICSGASVTLTVIGASTYTWNPGAIVGASTVVSPTISTSYTVTGTSVAGCTNTGVKTVSVNAVPSLTLTASPAGICVGLSSTLIANGANTYTWNPGAIANSSIVVSPTVTTTYTVNATSAAGCTASAVQGVTVGASLNLSPSSSPATICIGASATISASGATSYTWNPGALSGSNIVVNPTVTTIFTVAGTSGSCSGTSTLSLGVFTCAVGLTSATINDNAYSLYPNPTSDKLFIRANNNGVTDVNIEIMDAIGKIVLKQNHNFSAAENTVALNVNVMPAGIYLVKLTSLKDTKVIRFIKE